MRPTETPRERAPGGAAVRRWWLPLALLLSVGVNAGMLAAVLAGRRAPAPEAPAGGTPTLPGPGRELAGEIVVPGPPPGSPAGPVAPPPAGRPETGPPPPREAAPERPPGPPLGRLADELGLAGESRQRFLAIQRRFFLQVAAQRRERRQLTRELQDELTAAAPDRARVGALVDRLAAIYAASERATVDTILDTRELLDGEQLRLYLRFLGRLRAADPDRPGPGAGPARRPFRPRPRRP